MRFIKLAPAILAGVLLFCAACTADLPIENQEPPLPLTSTDLADLIPELNDDEQTALDLRLQRQEFSGSAGASAINEQLLALQEERLAQALANARINLQLAQENGEWDSSLPYYTYDATLRQALNDGQYLSLVLDVYEYTQGAAHPITYRYGYTFDALTGQRLTLEEIWGEEAIPQIAETIYRQIADTGQTADYFPNLSENLQASLGPDDWYLAEDDLHIIYNPYEIAAYVFGIQDFSLARKQ